MKKSIEHWERIASGNRKRKRDWKTGKRSLEILSVGHCDLCKLFHNNGCRECPVDKAGYYACDMTPVDKCAEIISDIVEIEKAHNSKEFKMAAKKEVEFLKSLLPKE